MDIHLCLSFISCGCLGCFLILMHWIILLIHVYQIWWTFVLFLFIKIMRLNDKFMFNFKETVRPFFLIKLYRFTFPTAFIQLSCFSFLVTPVFTFDYSIFLIGCTVSIPMWFLLCISFWRFWAFFHMLIGYFVLSSWRKVCSIPLPSF